MTEQWYRRKMELKKRGWILSGSGRFKLYITPRCKLKDPLELSKMSEQEFRKVLKEEENHGHKED
jgi:hypothetical protein